MMTIDTVLLSDVNCCLLCEDYVYCFFFSSRRRHTRCALVTGVQTCALPISHRAARPRRPDAASLHLQAAIRCGGAAGRPRRAHPRARALRLNGPNEFPHAHADRLLLRFLQSLRLPGLRADRGAGGPAWPHGRLAADPAWGGVPAERGRAAGRERVGVEV